MKAENLLDERVQISEGAFAEFVIWRVPHRVVGSSHDYKYRLAYVVKGVCVVRLDNEVGKGDHLHYEAIESSYEFSSIRQLLIDFNAQMQRWNHENRDS